MSINSRSDSDYVCIYLARLGSSFCFYPINIKTDKPIRPKLFVETKMTQEEVYGWSKLKNSLKIIDFLKSFNFAMKTGESAKMLS